MGSRPTAAGLESGKEQLQLLSRSDEEYRQISVNLRAALDAIMPEITANSIREMNEAKAKVASASKLLLASFGEQCDLLDEAEICLRTSIAEIKFEEGNPNQDLTVEYAMLSDRMKDYHEELKAKTRNLKLLWENWTSVQDDLVCLAIEQGGTKVLDIDAGTSANLLVKVKESEAAHKRFLEQDESIIVRYTDIAETQQQHRDEAKKRSQQHLKDISIQGSKFRRQVKDAIKDMQKI